MVDGNLGDFTKSDKVDKSNLGLLVIMAIAIFMQTLDATILSTALPSIAKDFDRPAITIQMVIISYTLSLAIIMPISGWAADKFGTMKMMMFSIIMFSVGSLMCAVSPSIEFLIFSRAVQGLGGAFLVPVSRLAMMKTFEKNTWLQVINWVAIPALIGPIIGPLLGGYLVEYFSWHWIFLINLPVGVLGMIFCGKYMRNFKEDESHLDFKGYIYFAIFAFCATLALDLLGKSDNYLFSLALFAVGVGSLWLYVRHARKREGEAIFPLELFDVRTFRVGIIGNVVCRLGISALPLVLPLFIQVAHKQSPSTAGLLIAPMALATVLTKPFMVSIINAFGYRNVLIFNTLITGVLITSLAIPSPDTPVVWFLPIMILLGMFNSIQFTAMNTITIANLKGYLESSGNTLTTVNQQMAISFGLACGASLVRFFNSTPAITGGSIHTAFRLSFVILGVLTMLSTLVFRKLHKQDGAELSSKKKA